MYGPIEIVFLSVTQGQGESEPNPYFFQNLAEAEYVVAVFTYMRLLGYPAESISILTTCVPVLPFLASFVGSFWFCGQDVFLPSFTGFYWVLLGFTGFYSALVGLDGFYCFLLGFIGF